LANRSRIAPKSRRPKTRIGETNRQRNCTRQNDTKAACCNAVVVLSITDLQRRAGRLPKGRQHTPTDLREMVLGALEDAGGRRYLAQRAIDTPGPFLALLGKVLPTTVANSDGSPIALHLIAAQLVSKHILELQAEPHIQTPVAAPVDTQRLLDAPPPEE
jgi:hypothetical protein